MFVRTGIALLLLVLAGYGVVKAIPLLGGPTITLTSPSEEQVFGDGFVNITGVAKHTENLSLNGGPLLIDEKGHFSTSFVLPKGSAILTLLATDRFGKTETVRRTIFVPLETADANNQR